MFCESWPYKINVSRKLTLQNERFAKGDLVKTSATLHGNAFLFNSQPSNAPSASPQKCPQPFEINCFGRFVEPHRSGEACASKKWSSPSGRQRAPKAIAQNSHFPDIFCKYCSSGSAWWPPPGVPCILKIVKKAMVL